MPGVGFGNLVLKKIRRLCAQGFGEDGDGVDLYVRTAFALKLLDIAGVNAQFFGEFLLSKPLPPPKHLEVFGESSSDM